MPLVIFPPPSYMYIQDRMIEGQNEEVTRMKEGLCRASKTAEARFAENNPNTAHSPSIGS